MILEKIKQRGGIISILRSLPDGNQSAFNLVLASLSINLLSLAVPIALMQAYDRIIPFQAKDTLLWLVVGALTALSLETLLRAIRAMISAWTGARFEHIVGCETVSRFLSGRLVELETVGLGAFVDRMGSVSVLRGFYAGQVFQILMDLPFAILFIVVIAYIGGWIALVPVMTALAFFAFVYWVKLRFESIRDNQIIVNDRKLNFIIELLNGIHLVKGQSLEELMLRRHERLQASAAEANMQAGTWGSIPGNVGGFISQATIFAIIGLGAMEVIQGEMTIGGLAASALLAGRALQPVQAAASFWLRLSDAEIARRRLIEIADIEPEVEPGTPAFPNDISGSIEFQNVLFGYSDDADPILNDVNFKVSPGQMIGFVGKSSSGTTTMLRLMLGILKPEKGKVYIDDYNISEWDRSNLRGRIEYVPQNGALFKGTILDNITMFDPNNYAAALDAANLLGLDELIAILPKGYETPVDSQSNNILPSGLVQRICIARAIVVRPRILIFDKADAALDDESREIFIRLLSRMKGKCTIILVSNDEEVLERTDKAYELFYGIIREKMSADEIEDITAIFD